MKKFFIISLVWLILVGRLAADDFFKEYTVYETPFYLGGYLSTEYIKGDRQEAFLFDDIAFLAYAEGARWDFVAELEAKNIYIEQSRPTDMQSSNLNFSIERLNLTYYIDDANTIRIGKFNTPVGFWNLTPINVLRETTSNPYIIDNTFPKLTSGLCYRRSINQNYDLLYIVLQNNDEIDSSYNNFNIKQHYSATLEIEKEIIYKGSVGYFKEREGSNSVYALAALRYDLFNHTFTLEASTRRKDSKTVVPYDIYFQYVWNFAEKYFLIGRIERYRTEYSKKLEEAIGVAGLTYRPAPNVAIKAEYDRYSFEKRDKILFSFSFIF